MAGTRDVLEIVREDDFVEYFIFPEIGLDCDQNEIKDRLSQVLTSLKNIINKYGSSYIWQKDEISLIQKFECEKLQVDESGKQFYFQ